MTLSLSKITSQAQTRSRTFFRVGLSESFHDCPQVCLLGRNSNQVKWLLPITSYQVKGDFFLEWLIISYYSYLLWYSNGPWFQQSPSGWLLCSLDMSSSLFTFPCFLAQDVPSCGQKNLDDRFMLQDRPSIFIFIFYYSWFTVFFNLFCTTKWPSVWNVYILKMYIFFSHYFPPWSITSD